MRGLLGLSQLMSGRGQFQQCIFNRAQWHTHTQSENTHLSDWDMVINHLLHTTHTMTSTMTSSAPAENLKKVPELIFFLCLILSHFLSHFSSWHLSCLHFLSSFLLCSPHLISSGLYASSRLIFLHISSPLFKFLCFVSVFSFHISSVPIVSLCISLFPCLFTLLSSPKLSSFFIFHHSLSPLSSSPLVIPAPLLILTPLLHLFYHLLYHFLSLHLA